MPQQNRHPQAYRNRLSIENETGTNGGVTEIHLGGERDRDRDRDKSQKQHYKPGEGEINGKETCQFYWNKKVRLQNHTNHKMKF